MPGLKFALFFCMLERSGIPLYQMLFPKTMLNHKFISVNSSPKILGQVPPSKTMLRL